MLLAKPLGKPEEEISKLTEKHSNKGRQFDVGNDTHDRYTIRPDGSLDISDDSGLIDKARPVLATTTDQKLIDQAIAKTIVKTNSSAFWMPIQSQQTLTTFADSIVRPRLREPASGQFSRLHGALTDQGNYLCGDVNAKNGFGGYSGPQRFAAAVSGPIAGQVFFEGPNQKNAFAKYWSICAGS